MKFYNFLTRSIESFTPIHPKKVGMYVCGPTVYGDSHFGHARSAVVFDVLYRYLEYQGYQVRYVRNITDVGHLEDEELEQGEDKLEKAARIMRLEPMEIAHYYTTQYHRVLDLMGVKSPSLEPLASGHVMEQQEFIEKLLQSGMAYEVNGNVYFDLHSFVRTNKVYGILSGKQIDETLHGTRVLKHQDDKRHEIDFAVWKRVGDNQVTHWKSPWHEKGVPGWHTECCVMSEKYLGIPFDIHGGGLDLQFPHHEAEIAQQYALHGKVPAKYWLYNNMITIDNKKMSKSLGNFITMEQCFKGEHNRISQAYAPMFMRFFFLRAHYRSVIDISDEALQSALQGYKKLTATMDKIKRIVYKNFSTPQPYNKLEDNSINYFVTLLQEKSSEAMPSSRGRELKETLESLMNEDLDTTKVIAHLFKQIDYIKGFSDTTTDANEILFSLAYYVFFTLVLGIDDASINTNQQHEDSASSDTTIDGLVNTILELRNNARSNKDFATSDKLRDALLSIGIQISDNSDGSCDWNFTER